MPLTDRLQSIGLLGSPQWDLNTILQSLESIPESKIPAFQQLMGGGQMQAQPGYGGASTLSPFLMGMSGFGTPTMSPYGSGFGFDEYGPKPFGGYLPQEMAAMQGNQPPEMGLDENAPWYQQGAYYGGKGLEALSPYLMAGVGALGGPFAPLYGAGAGALSKGLGSALKGLGTDRTLPALFQGAQTGLNNLFNQFNEQQ